jgi:hypothetical protein
MPDGHTTAHRHEGSRGSRCCARRSTCFVLQRIASSVMSNGVGNWACWRSYLDGPARARRASIINRASPRLIATCPGAAGSRSDRAPRGDGRLPTSPEVPKKEIQPLLEVKYSALRGFGISARIRVEFGGEALSPGGR